MIDGLVSGVLPAEWWTTIARLSNLAAAALFIVGIKMLGSPATARRGNWLAAVGMAMAIGVTLLDRSGLVEPNDCGDGNGNKTSGRAYKCGVDNPGNSDGGTVTNPPAPNADAVPYVGACLCTLGRRADAAGGPPGLALGALALIGLRLAARRSRRSP